MWYFYGSAKQLFNNNSSARAQHNALSANIGLVKVIFRLVNFQWNYIYIYYYVVLIETCYCICIFGVRANAKVVMFSHCTCMVVDYNWPDSKSYNSLFQNVRIRKSGGNVRKVVWHDFSSAPLGPLWYYYVVESVVR